MIYQIFPTLLTATLTAHFMSSELSSFIVRNISSNAVLRTGGAKYIHEETDTLVSTPERIYVITTFIVLTY